MKSKNFFFNFLRHYSFLGLILFIACWSCKKEDNPEPITIPEKIIGRWDWYQTIIPKPYALLTPETQGATGAIKFESYDSVRFYRNDTLQLTYFYQILHKPADALNPTGDSIWALFINHGSESHLFLMNDTLNIDQSYVDGGSDYYVRKH